MRLFLTNLFSFLFTSHSTCQSGDFCSSSSRQMSEVDFVCLLNDHDENERVSSSACHFRHHFKAAAARRQETLFLHQLLSRWRGSKSSTGLHLQHIAFLMRVRFLLFCFEHHHHNQHTEIFQDRRTLWWLYSFQSHPISPEETRWTHLSSISLVICCERFSIMKFEASPRAMTFPRLITSQS